MYMMVSKKRRKREGIQVRRTRNTLREKVTMYRCWSGNTIARKRSIVRGTSTSMHDALKHVLVGWYTVLEVSYC